MVGRIATGRIEEVKSDPGKEYARKGGLKGGKARAAKLSKERRKQIAQKAASARWEKGRVRNLACFYSQNFTRQRHTFRC